MTPNVDLFAYVGAALFAKLYRAFPLPIDIETDILADEALAEDPDGAPREAFVEASLLWLANAGLIVFEPNQLGARMIERVGLTAKGFLALTSAGSAGGETASNPDERRRSMVAVLGAAASS